MSAHDDDLVRRGDVRKAFADYSSVLDDFNEELDKVPATFRVGDRVEHDRVCCLGTVVGVSDCGLDVRFDDGSIGGMMERSLFSRVYRPDPQPSTSDLARLRAEVERLEKELVAEKLVSIKEAELVKVNADLMREVERLTRLAYIGDHHFPDLTYKARLEELVPKCRAAEPACGTCGGSGITSAPYELDAEDCPACRKGGGA